jgi:putative transposase
MKYIFIEKHAPQYPVRQLCQTLEVSHSGYYDWRKRQASPKDPHLEALLAHIARIHKRSHDTYGSPRVHAQLRREGFHYNRKRIARLMRLKGLVGRRKTRKVTTTDSRHDYPVAENLLNREFQLLDAQHITVSMSRTADCYDNAVMESFFSTIWFANTIHFVIHFGHYK